MRKIEFTQDMINDLRKMGDREFSKKWKVSRQLIIRRRKELHIKSYNNQHGTINHRFINGIEYKWCSFGHWGNIINFGKHNKNLDGLRNWCKKHSSEKNNLYYIKNNRIEYHKNWRSTEIGKNSLRITWLKTKSKKANAYIFWSDDDGIFVYSVFEDICPWCGNKSDELEHFIPISKGGQTIPGNLYPVCIECNRGKGGKFCKHPLNWAIEKFGINLGYEKYNNIVEKLNRCKEYYKSRLTKP